MRNDHNATAVRRRSARYRGALLAALLVESLGLTPAGADVPQPNRAAFDLKRKWSVDDFRSELEIAIDYSFAPRLAFETELVVWDPRRFAAPPPDNQELFDVFDAGNFGEIESKLKWAWNAATSQWPEFFGVLEANTSLYRGNRISRHYPESIVGIGTVRKSSKGKIETMVGYALYRDRPATDVPAYEIELVGQLGSRTRLDARLEGEGGALHLETGPRWRWRSGITVQLQLGLAREPRDANVEREIRLLFAY